MVRPAIFAFCMFLPSIALADGAVEETLVHHAPIAVASESEQLTVNAKFDRPDKAKHVYLVYKTGDAVHEIAFERAEYDFAASIPASDVHAPHLAYAIEVEDTQGTRHDAFASRQAMHEVEVLEDEGDLRERAQLERLDKRRSQLALSTEYAYFGTETTTLNGTPTSVRDEYWRVDGSYTFRILRLVSEFGISFGVVRGSSIVPNAQSAKEYDVGLNYGAPRIRFRATDWLHFDFELLTSITEVGFSVGGGGAVILGSPYATHVTLGGEGVQVFGARGFARVDIPAGKRLVVAPTIEVTNMPHASTAGVRLLLDANILLGRGFSIGLRAGYMARNFDNGGFGGGLQAGYAF
jgi:hypothetical protein